MTTKDTNPAPSWKEFRKNHPEDFRKCCGNIYYKCKCKQKDKGE